MQRTNYAAWFQRWRRRWWTWRRRHRPTTGKISSMTLIDHLSSLIRFPPIAQDLPSIEQSSLISIPLLLVLVHHCYPWSHRISIIHRLLSKVHPVIRLLHWAIPIHHRHRHIESSPTRPLTPTMIHRRRHCVRQRIRVSFMKPINSLWWSTRILRVWRAMIHRRSLKDIYIHLSNKERRRVPSVIQILRPIRSIV